VSENTLIDDDFVAAVRRDMLKFAQLQLRDAAQAEDAVQEALAGALGARIPALIRGGQLEAAVGLPLGLEESRVMICGSPDMVRDCHQALMERGFRLSRLAAPAQIAVENAW